MKPMRHIRKSLKAFRAKLRRNPPEPERLLWRRIRGTQFGTKFRRQHSIGPHILDFYAPEARLAIELDGESHAVSERARERDTVRDAALAAEGILTLRFTNVDVMQNIEGICERIREVIAQHRSHPL